MGEVGAGVDVNVLAALLNYSLIMGDIHDNLLMVKTVDLWQLMREQASDR
jgi:hypothetical protein